MRLEEKFVSAAALKHGQSGGKSPDRSGHAGTSHFESAFASAARKPQPAPIDTASETSTKLQDQASATALAASANDDDNDPHAAVKHHLPPEGESHDDARTRGERPAVERREERSPSRDQRQPPQRESTNRTVSATDTAATRAVEPRTTYQSAAGVQSASARGAPLQTLSGQLAGQTLALLTPPSARGVETMPSAGQTDPSPVDRLAQELSVPGEGSTATIDADVEPKVQGQTGDTAGPNEAGPNEVGPHEAGKSETPLRPARTNITPSAPSLAAGATSSTVSAAGDRQPAATATAKASTASAAPASAVATTTSRAASGADHITPLPDKTGAAPKEAGVQTVPSKPDAVARTSRIIDAGIRSPSAIAGGAAQTAQSAQEMRTPAADRTTPSSIVRGATTGGIPLARGVEVTPLRQSVPTAAILPKTVTAQASVLPGQSAMTAASTNKAAIAAKVAADMRALPAGAAATPAAGRVLPTTTAQAALSIRTVAGEQNVLLRPAIDVKGALAAQPAAGQEGHSTAQPGARPATAIPTSLTAAAAIQTSVAADAKVVPQATRQAEAKAPVDTRIAAVTARPVSSAMLQGTQTPATLTRSLVIDNQKAQTPAARHVAADLAVASKGALAGTTPGQAMLRTTPMLSASLPVRDDKLLAGDARSINGKTPDIKVIDAKTAVTAAADGTSAAVRLTDAKTAGATRTQSDSRLIGAAEQAMTTRAVEIRTTATPAQSSETKSGEAKARELKTPDARTTDAKTTDTKTTDTKAAVATRMMPAVAEKTAEHITDSPTTKTTPARSPLGERIATGTQAKPAIVSMPAAVLTPAMAARVADTTSAAPAAQRKDTPLTPVSTATQKTVAEPVQRAHPLFAESRSDATAAKTETPVAGRRTETLTRSAIPAEKAAAVTHVHSTIADHAVADHSGDDARPKVTVATDRTTDTDRTATDRATPRPSTGGIHDAVSNTHSTTVSPSPAATGKAETSTTTAVPVPPETGLKPPQRVAENLPDKPIKAERADVAAVKTDRQRTETTLADPAFEAAPVTADVAPPVSLQTVEGLPDKLVNAEGADVAPVTADRQLTETTPVDPVSKAVPVKADVSPQTAEHMPDKPVTTGHADVAAVKADVPRIETTLADPALKDAPVTIDTPHPVSSHGTLTAHVTGAGRQSTEAGTVQRPLDKVVNDKIADKAAVPVAAKEELSRAEPDPAAEPLPDLPAAPLSAAETLIDRLLMARSAAAQTPQAVADSANPAFSLLNAASYRPMTLDPSRQGQPVEARPVTARSEERVLARDHQVDRQVNRLADRTPETRDAALPALPSASLADRTTDKTVALPGTDQNFRFTRADGRGQAMSVSLSADGDRATITPEPAGLGNRTETVTVLDSRRFLGVTPVSNAQAVTSLIPTDPQWANAMRLGALGELGADPHAATGKVVNTLKIQMHPIELGLVTATLRLKDDELHVDLKVETGEAYRQLSDDQGAMVKALRAQGFAVDQINIVYTASDSASSSGNGASQPQTNQNAGQGGRERPAEGSLQGGERNGSSNGDQQGSGDRRTRREALDDGPLVNGRTRAGDVYM